MAYTTSPELEFNIYPSKEGKFLLHELDINYSRWSDLKRCLDILYWMEYMTNMHGNEFPTSRNYLNFIFSHKSKFAQKLMTCLLIRGVDKFKLRKIENGKVIKNGESYKYHVCIEQYNLFISKIRTAIEKISRKNLDSYKPAHHRRTEKKWNKKSASIKKQEKTIKTNIHYTAIDVTFSSPDFSEVQDESWRNRLYIYHKIYASELCGLKEFSYNEVKFRRHHPLQLIKKEYQELFFKYSIFRTNADLNTAALSSLIANNEKYLETDVESTFPILFDYINNRKHFRDYFGELFELDKKQAKKMFAHLINKGNISFSSFSCWKETIQDDFTGLKTMKAKQNIWLMSFYEEIKLLWKLNKQSAKIMFEKGDIDFEINDKNKFDLYFFLERKIIEVCEKELKARNIKYFLMHDGWRCDKDFSTKEFELAIFKHLQLDMEIEKEN